MTSRVECGLLVDKESGNNSFLFTVESDGQLNRDVNVMNKQGRSIVAISLSTAEALDVARQIHSQYLSWSQQKLEEDRREIEDIKRGLQDCTYGSDEPDADMDRESDPQSLEGAVDGPMGACGETPSERAGGIEPEITAVPGEPLPVPYGVDPLMDSESMVDEEEGPSHVSD